jgi:hypothetical protein
MYEATKNFSHKSLTSSFNPENPSGVYSGVDTYHRL